MKEWLSGFVGESTANILGFVLIFVLILGAIFTVVAMIKRFSGNTFSPSSRSRQPRLSVMDAAAVDSRRKLVLIRRDDVEHLLLIGGPTDVVVEQNIVLQSRAHSLSTPSKIEPEHIERFRQQEASLTNERASVSLGAPDRQAEPEAIQLNSPVESKPYRRPEPVDITPPQPVAAPVRPAAAAPVAAPMAAAPMSASVTSQPASDASQRREPVMAPVPPRPRPVQPSYPPQPRTVQPQREPANPTATRSHPPYPLSQVSRGVVTATSAALAAAAAGSAAAAASSSEVVKPSIDPVTPPAPQFTETKSFEVSPAVERIEPTIASVSPATKAVDEPDLDLDSAIHDAIVADLAIEAPVSKPAEHKEPELSADLSPELSFENLEDELLSSLDVDTEATAKKQGPADDIEDEMAKLLNELSGNER